MLLDLLDKLIDRCIQLSRERNEAQERLFERELNPIQQQLQLVHDAYLASLREYLAILEDTTVPFPTRAATVRRKAGSDNLFSADQRIKLSLLLDHRGTRDFGDPPVVAPFLASVRRYILGSLEDTAGTRATREFTTMLTSQAYRTGIVNGLDEIEHLPDATPADRTRLSLALVDQVLRHLQMNYAGTMQAYLALQKELT
jgi:hypothetical protein